MARQFEADVRAALDGSAVAGEGRGTHAGFFAWVEGAPAEGYRAPRMLDVVDAGRAAPAPEPDPTLPVALVTGEYGARVLAPLADDLADAAGVPVRLVTVANQFFGGNIGVTGLLTGADIAAALEREPAGERYLVPDVVLSNGRFLDGTTPDTLPRTVEFVPTDGASLVAALRPRVRVS